MAPIGSEGGGAVDNFSVTDLDNEPVSDLSEEFGDDDDGDGDDGDGDAPPARPISKKGKGSAKVDDPDGDESSIARELGRSGEQPRRENGKFEKKSADQRERERKPDAKTKESKPESDDLMSEIERELKDEGLDKDSKEGKDRGAKKDPAAKKDPGATDKAKPEQTSADATRLEKARQALKLAGWTEGEIGDLSPGHLVKAGELAQASIREKNAELRAQKQQGKTGMSDRAEGNGAATDDSKSRATHERQVEAELHGIAEEAFADLDDPSGLFVPALSTFSKRVTEFTAKRVQSEVSKTLEAHKAEMQETLTQARREVMGELRFEQNRERLAGTWSQLKSKEGLAAFRERVADLAKLDKFDDVRELMDSAAMSLWGKDVVEREAARQRKLTAAKARGQFIPSSSTSTPRDMDDIEEISHHLRTGRPGRD